MILLCESHSVRQVIFSTVTDNYRPYLPPDEELPGPVGVTLPQYKVRRCTALTLRKVPVQACRWCVHLCTCLKRHLLEQLAADRVCRQFTSLFGTWHYSCQQYTRWS